MDEVALRPVLEDDLPFADTLTNDPQGAGPYEWLGWHDPGDIRRRWAQTGLLTDDRGFEYRKTGSYSATGP